MTELNPEARKNEILITLSGIALEIHSYAQSARVCRYHPYQDKDESLLALAPAFEMIAKIHEKAMLEKCGKFSQLYNEYMMIGKRR